jgi:hypothetical protein
MSSYTHTKNGLCKFIEHHHGETKQFIESGADISYLTNHFFSDSFYLSLVTMAVPITDDYLECTHVVLPVVQEADQPTGTLCFVHTDKYTPYKEKNYVSFYFTFFHAHTPSLPPMLQNNKLCYLPELHVTVLYTLYVTCL